MLAAGDHDKRSGMTDALQPRSDFGEVQSLKMAGHLLHPSYLSDCV